MVMILKLVRYVHIASTVFEQSRECPQLVYVLIRGLGLIKGKSLKAIEEFQAR